MSEEKIYKGCIKIELHQDELAGNPRQEFDNLTVFHCFHRNYSLGDNPKETVEEFQEYKESEPDSVFFTLYGYDHGGISMSLTREYPFNCPWDSGTLGEIEVPRKNILDNWPGLSEQEFKLKAWEVALQEVEQMNQYLSGDVWGFKISSPEDEHEDSCWGFYGHKYAMEEAEEAAENIYQEYKKFCEEFLKNNYGKPVDVQPEDDDSFDEEFRGTLLDTLTDDLLFTVVDQDDNAWNIRKHQITELPRVDE